MLPRGTIRKMGQYYRNTHELKVGVIRAKKEFFNKYTKRCGRLFRNILIVNV